MEWYSQRTYLDYAGVAEQADARDLKSLGLTSPCRFKSGLRHQSNQQVMRFSLHFVTRIVM